MPGSAPGSPFRTRTRSRLFTNVSFARRSRADEAHVADLAPDGGPARGPSHKNKRALRGGSAITECREDLKQAFLWLKPLFELADLVPQVTSSMYFLADMLLAVDRKFQGRLLPADDYQAKCAFAIADGRSVRSHSVLVQGAISGRYFENHTACTHRKRAFRRCCKTSGVRGLGVQTPSGNSIPSQTPGGCSRRSLKRLCCKLKRLAYASPESKWDEVSQLKRLWKENRPPSPTKAPAVEAAICDAGDADGIWQTPHGEEDYAEDGVGDGETSSINGEPEDEKLGDALEDEGASDQDESVVGTDEAAGDNEGTADDEKTGDAVESEGAAEHDESFVGTDEAAGDDEGTSDIDNGMGNNVDETAGDGDEAAGDDEGTADIDNGIGNNVGMEILDNDRAVMFAECLRLFRSTLAKADQPRESPSGYSRIVRQTFGRSFWIQPLVMWVALSKTRGQPASSRAKSTQTHRKV